ATWPIRERHLATARGAEAARDLEPESLARRVARIGGDDSRSAIGDFESHAIGIERMTNRRQLDVRSGRRRLMRVLDQIDEDFQRERWIDIDVGTIVRNARFDRAALYDERQMLARGAKEIGGRRRFGTRHHAARFESR